MTAYCGCINAIIGSFFYLAETTVWLLRDLTPDTYFYWKMRAYFLCRWLALSMDWWTILISGYYFEPEMRPGKFNGTYWMHIRADQYAGLDGFKDIEYM
jgi:hypothetical protein